MAPTSHLLVYYTTDSGETINDVISFNVKQTDPKVTVRRRISARGSIG